MTALVLFEARKAARNPLVWIGAALMFGVATLNAVGYWPSVPDDAGFAYEGLLACAPFVLLVGAWLGLRDRTSGAEQLVASTPYRARGLVVPARMGAVALVAFAACTLGFVATAALSVARGGRGVPDAFLVLDAGLYVALAACGGFAIGYLTGSRILSLLAAPVLPGAVFYLQGVQSGRVTEPSWLLPNPPLPGRFGPLGYLPDVFPMHAAYLAGAVLALVGIVWTVTGRRERSSTTRLGIAAAVTGAVVFVAAGASLAGEPGVVHVFGPSAPDRVEIHSPADYDLLPPTGRLADGIFGELATECEEVDGIRACVFPEYGPRLARALAEDASPLAAFRSLDGIPDRVTMVPTSPHSGSDQCTTGDELLVGSWHVSIEFQRYQSLAQAGFYCAVYGPRQISNRAAEVLLHGWFSVRVTRGLTGDAYLTALRRGWGRRATDIVGNLRDVPIAEVVSRLEPIWDEVRARETTLAELRRALGT